MSNELSQRDVLSGAPAVVAAAALPVRTGTVDKAALFGGLLKQQWPMAPELGIEVLGLRWLRGKPGKTSATSISNDQLADGPGVSLTSGAALVFGKAAFWHLEPNAALLPSGRALTYRPEQPGSPTRGARHSYLRAPQ